MFLVSDIFVIRWKWFDALWRQRSALGLFWPICSPLPQHRPVSQSLSLSRQISFAKRVFTLWNLTLTLNHNVVDLILDICLYKGNIQEKREKCVQATNPPRTPPFCPFFSKKTNWPPFFGWAMNVTARGHGISIKLLKLQTEQMLMSKKKIYIYLHKSSKSDKVTCGCIIGHHVMAAADDDVGNDEVILSVFGLLAHPAHFKISLRFCHWRPLACTLH